MPAPASCRRWRPGSRRWRATSPSSDRRCSTAHAERERLAADLALKPTPADPATVLADARPIRGRRLMVWLAILALVVGILAVIDAFTTLVFQEPITKLITARAQSAASADLDKLESSYADSPERAHETIANRRARLAGALQHDTRTGEPLGRLLIPSIGVKSVFIEGAAESALRKGPGRYTETSMPGRPGTVGIAGHRTTFSAPFRDIDKLKPGQRIVLRMPYARFSYVVQGTRIVSPKDAWVLRSYGSEGRRVAAETQSRLVLTALPSDRQREGADRRQRPPGVGQGLQGLEGGSIGRSGRSTSGPSTRIRPGLLPQPGQPHQKVVGRSLAARAGIEDHAVDAAARRSSRRSGLRTLRSSARSQRSWWKKPPSQPTRAARSLPAGDTARPRCRDRRDRQAAREGLRRQTDSC